MAILVSQILASNISYFLRNFNYCDYLEPLIILAANTGIRKGEILGLEWSHIDLEKEFLTVISGNSKSGKRHGVIYLLEQSSPIFGSMT